MNKRDYYEYITSQRQSDNLQVKSAAYMALVDIYEDDKSCLPNDIIEELEREKRNISNEYLLSVIDDTIYQIKYAD